jgi:hypothetical protein
MVIQPLLIKEKIMKLQRYLAFILAMFTFTSCGYTITKVEPTTTSSTTTTVAIKYGESCNGTVSSKLDELATAVTEASEKRSGGNNTSTSKELINRMQTWREFRSYLRSLDLPTMEFEKTVYVDIIEDYVSAINRYMESGKTDLSVNDYITPLQDAGDDFYTLFETQCASRVVS